MLRRNMQLLKSQDAVAKRKSLNKSTDKRQKLEVVVMLQTEGIKQKESNKTSYMQSVAVVKLQHQKRSFFITRATYNVLSIYIIHHY